MHHLITMAVRIDEETYSLAVACLPPAFATFPFKDVVNHYLIINQVETKFGKKATRQVLTIGNSWMTEELFRESWQFIYEEVPTRLCAVEKIAS